MRDTLKNIAAHYGYKHTDKIGAITEEFLDYAEVYAEHGATDTEPRTVFMELVEAKLEGKRINWSGIDWHVFYGAPKKVEENLTKFAKNLLSKI